MPVPVRVRSAQLGFARVRVRGMRVGPSGRCPSPGFAGRAAGEVFRWLLAEGAQGAGQQWRGTVGRQGRRAVGLPSCGRRAAG